MGNVHPLNEGLLSSGHLPGCVGTGGYSGEPQSLDSALKRARLEHAYPWLPQQSESEHSVSFTSPLGSNSSLREETHTGVDMTGGQRGLRRNLDKDPVLSSLSIFPFPLNHLMLPSFSHFFLFMNKPLLSSLHIFAPIIPY